MRKDMYKVIVERPRRGGHYGTDRQPPLDPEDQPQYESLKLRHRSRKWLNENLRPLERYLHAQAGRPWGRVYSELCARIDRRNTVQQHIHQHLDDFVAMRLAVVDNRLHYERGWGGLHPLDDPWAPQLYVHPDSGLLLYNRAARQAKRAAKRERARERAALASRESADMRVLDEWHQLHRIEGVWYRIELAQLATQPSPSPKDRHGPPAYDAVLRREVRWSALTCGRAHCRSCSRYGRPWLYARSKRQLNRHELQRYGLSNHDDRRLH